MAEESLLARITKRIEDSKRGGPKTMEGGIADSINVKPVQKFTESTQEGHDGHHVVAFGRMNPPTAGHQAVVNKVNEIAKRYHGSAHIHLSKTHDPHRNPLSYEDKVNYAKKAFGPAVKDTTAKTIMHVAAEHHGKAQHLHVVAGSDRVDEFHKLLHKYNGKHGAHGFYHFKSIHVHSAGQRDPDSEGVTGTSATKMRDHAISGREKEFTSGLPNKIKPHAEEIMGKIKRGMNLQEILDRSLRRKRNPKDGVPNIGVTTGYPQEEINPALATYKNQKELISGVEGGDKNAGLFNTPCSIGGQRGISTDGEKKAGLLNHDRRLKRWVSFKEWSSGQTGQSETTPSSGDGAQISITTVMRRNKKPNVSVKEDAYPVPVMPTADQTVADPVVRRRLRAPKKSNVSVAEMSTQKLTNYTIKATKSMQDAAEKSAGSRGDEKIKHAKVFAKRMQGLSRVERKLQSEEVILTEGKDNCGEYEEMFKKAKIPHLSVTDNTRDHYMGSVVHPLHGKARVLTVMGMPYKYRAKALSTLNKVAPSQHAGYHSEGKVSHFVVWQGKHKKQ